MSTRPHDALVRSVFSQTEHAQGQLQHMLPPAIVAGIDWRSLTLVPGTFIDEALRDSVSDFLFSVFLNERQALLYFLVEHDSAADRSLVFHVLSSEIRIWTGWRRGNPAPSLPPIVPMLLCYADRPRSGPTRFEDLFDADPDTFTDLADLVPRFRLLVDDLATQEDAALRARPMTPEGRLTLWCLRHCRDDVELGAPLSAWADLWRDLAAAPDGLDAIDRLAKYLFTVHRHEDELVSKFRSLLSANAMNPMRSVADGLRASSRHTLGKRMSARKISLFALLMLRHGTVVLEHLTKLHSATLDDLTVWLRRTLTEPTLERILDETGARPSASADPPHDFEETTLERENAYCLAAAAAADSLHELEGMRKALTALLTGRFGPLPDEVTLEIRTHANAQIEEWARRAVTQSALDAVFDDLSPTE